LESKAKALATLTSFGLQYRGKIIMSEEKSYIDAVFEPERLKLALALLEDDLPPVSEERFQKIVARLKATLLERFVSSLNKSIEQFKQNAENFADRITLYPIQPQLCLGSEADKSENTANYQFDKLQLGIIAYDDEHTIQLKIKWLGNKPVNIFLLEEQEPVQKSMGTHFAEFIFNPSLAHTIVTQDANGEEIYRLPLDKVE
jgi:hypothetical protein